MVDDAYRRMLARRTTHRSRSVAVSVALILAALGLAYVGTECVLAALGRDPLLLAPRDAMDSWISGSPLVLGSAALAAVLGLVVLLLAVFPGRRPRHRLRDERLVLVVDDEVLASAVSQHLARGAGVAAGQVRTALGRRRAEVQLRPTSGHPLDAAELQERAEAVVTRLEPIPAIRTRVRLSRDGVVGG